MKQLSLFSKPVQSTEHKKIHSGKKGVGLVYPTRYFACDFETTVYENQTETEVWSAALAEINTKDEAIVLHSIDEFWKYVSSLHRDVICYFHNLKFDGSFILSYFMLHTNLKQAYFNSGSTDFYEEWYDDDEMPVNSFKYSISSEGQWYSIKVKLYSSVQRHYIFIEFRDSLKLMPFSLKAIGKAFNTEHRKLNMEYVGYRYAGCPISDEELEYIKNDVYVLREALEFLFNNGQTKLTIGSCCLEEFKSFYDSKDYKAFFPDLTKYDVPSDEYDATTCDEYIRNSYRGGWCYVVKNKAGRIYSSVNCTGTVADVNSLYPSMMHSMSGNKFPTGLPTFWKGNYIPDKLTNPNTAPNYYYFIRIQTRFKLKQGMLPTIQIKGSPFYKGTDMLETSDYIDEHGVPHQYIADVDSEGHKVINEVKPILTLTWNDYELIKLHYDLIDTVILDGCWFYSNGTIPLFDEYINKWGEIKQTSKGAMRTEAKLFLNNLYGKMATSPVGDYKIAYLGENSELKFRNVRGHEKKAGYIPIGSAITSYARCFTIKAAQANYHGDDAPGFIYADTDSIHCDLPPSELVGITIHDTKFCCWKIESQWDEARFLRAKTYIEHTTHSDGVQLTEPFYEIKCAGMPPRCKEQFVMSMTRVWSDEWWEKATDEMKEFVEKPRSIKDFDVGLKIYGKLMPKQIKGGVILVDTHFEMKKKSFY